MSASIDRNTSGSRTGVSRRGLLGAFPAMAAAGVGLGLLGGALEPTTASAAVGDALLLGEANDAGASTTMLTSTTTGAVLAVTGSGGAQETDISGGFLSLVDTISGGGGLMFRTQDPAAHLMAQLSVNQGPGLLTVLGRTIGEEIAVSGDMAIVAESVASTALQAHAASGSNAGGEVTGTGVDASADGHGTGVRASSVVGSGLVASNTDPKALLDAVVVTTAGLGRALCASSTNTAGQAPTVLGVNKGVGAGLHGIQGNPTSTGAAVIGAAAAKGRGAQFSGGAAAVRMVPSAARTHPPTGLPGDFFVDSETRLWFCKGGGVWLQLA
jgi:hypothetical protein